MDETKIRELLEQLRKELAQIDSVDEKGQALLRRVDEDIHQMLERTGGEEPNSLASVIKGLEYTIQDLEEKHPTITAALSQMLNTLSNAGI